MRPSSFMKTRCASFRKSDDPSRESAPKSASRFVAVAEIRASSFPKFNDETFILSGKFDPQTRSVLFSSFYTTIVLNYILETYIIIIMFDNIQRADIC